MKVDANAERTAHRVPSSALAEQLSKRRGEIEQATAARIQAISDPRDVRDPEYATGLREAVVCGIEYALAAIEESGMDGPPIPPVPVQLLAQARQAARNRVSIDTVLRRYFAAYTLLTDFLVEVAGEGEVAISELQWALRRQAVIVNHVVRAVSEEYLREVKTRCRSAEERRAAQVRKLLEGERIEARTIDYELNAWHVGLIATGPNVLAALRKLAKTVDRRPLTVHVKEGALWAWFGGRSKIGSQEILAIAESSWSEEMALAIGEPGHGVGGWRLTHRQAAVSWPIAKMGSQRLVRYADVGVLASVLRDQDLANSLRQIYLEPLNEERDGGTALRTTLRTYFAAQRNSASTAAALGITRQTVTNRLRAVEERLLSPVSACAAELEIALRLEELEESAVDSARAGTPG